MMVRQARTGDAEAIRDLINVAFRVERFFVDGDRIGLGEVRSLLSQGEFLVTEDEGLLTGCVYVEFRGERGYLGLLSVDPARQGSGVGTRLALAAEERCRELGARFVDLQIVSLREELPGFYRRLGYIDDGTAPFPADVPTKLPCHFLKMFKRL
jgi:N-acetylglutamate synthase-like GNAT family acetyltransferase